MIDQTIIADVRRLVAGWHLQGAKWIEEICIYYSFHIVPYGPRLSIRAGLQAWKLNTSHRKLNVRKISEHPVIARITLENINHHLQRFSPNFRQITLLRFTDLKCQGFLGRAKPCIYPHFVSSCINAIPAEILEVDGIQSMQAVWRPVLTNRQALIAQAGRNAICPQKSCQQMTFSVAIARSVSQHIRGFASHRIKPEIRTVMDFISHKIKTAAHQIVL